MLNAPADRVWQEAQTTRLLDYVVAPLIVFRPVTPATLPEIWEEAKYLVEIRLFGAIPFGQQWINISFASTAPPCYQLEDAGHSKIILRWQHHITICESGETSSRYSDEIDIAAGVLTPFIWAYAQVLFRFRQWRWRKLVNSGFRY